MFNLVQVVGYTQFMVYVVIRLIITGALAGRLFTNDQDNIKCNSSLSADDNRTSSHDVGSSLQLNASENFYDSSDVKSACLRVAYSGNISPLGAWALTLLTAVIPWLVLAPWTPFEVGRNLFSCLKESCSWPCLTIYMSAMLRAALRLLLEIVALVTIIAAYRMYVPQFVRCYDETIWCVLHESQEKTCFLWMLTAVNFITALLSVWEIKHIYSNREEYEKDEIDTYTFREIPFSSTQQPPSPATNASPLLATTTPPNWQATMEQRTRFEGASTSGKTESLAGSEENEDALAPSIDTQSF